ncbi:SusC/RagA family TonB-linked outer membrane protein [Gracilimonas mengyeensis]|uniref:TonB-linked outer membrane protein, SusC/RagA family n=1 Tax=Gracilimonas mengyeensis TaxID=1302730 RepID=A0A521BSF2_9BACT|nr:SusC/RagA family TonB-linked outer membrane protein [Gracilimonas mengyeensis]SMO50102.1 TonB-linked outer membrane protein, SusC/RagA family [Gracilimonas mengyeensis]
MVSRLRFKLRFSLVVMVSAFMFSVTAYGQGTVTGVVTDATDGSVLPGVNVILQNTTTGISTDVNGEYSLDVPSLSDTLVFSFVGYERLQVPIGGRETINVALQPEAIEGEELVVVGYGTQSRRTVSGSISSVSADELSTVARNSFNQMLQGQAPGLNLQRRSAQPGGGLSVNVRGAISPGGSNQPLYVIDGVPLTDNSSTVPGLFDEGSSGSVLGFYGGVDRDPLSYLNPSDIESISVMKDASAAAIYGSAAANGVVLITTKSGAAGKIQVDYRGSVTTQRPHDYIPLLNAEQFMRQQNRLAHEYHRYENNLPPYGNNDPANYTYTQLFSESQMNSAGEGTYWPDLVMEDGWMQEHNFTVSGGNETTRIYTSFNFQDDQAILKSSSLTRYSGRLNLDQELGDFARLNVRTSISRIDGNNPTTGSSIGGADLYNMIQASVAYAPNLDVYEEGTGEYTRTYNTLIMNPVSFLDISDESETQNISVAPKLEMDFTDNLMGTVTAQYNSEKTQRGFYLPRTSRHANLSDGMAQKNLNSRKNSTVEGFLTWDKAFENSELTAVAGAGMYQVNNEGFGLVGIGFFTDAFRDNNVGAAEDAERNELTSYKDERTKLSQFMRLNYTLDDKYILTGVVRRDGSSVFSENNKWGVFPGVSAAWIVSEEDFMRDYSDISELKVRLGYGLAGNESVLSGNTLRLYGTGFSYLIGNTVRNGVTLTQIENPNLTWETVQTINFGLDFGFFRNRIRGGLDIYQKTAKDLLDFNTLPFNNAVGLVADNVGSTESQGIELSLTTQNFQSQTFQWSTNFNVSYYRSYWKERNTRVDLPEYIGETDDYGAIYGWETNGIIKSESDRPSHMADANLGNVIYVDQNGDGQLNSEDVVQIGNGIPKWSIGLGNNFSAGNFTLSVFVYGDLDFDRYNNYTPNVAGLRLTGAPLNTTKLARKVWSSDNPNGIRPGVADNPYTGNNPEGDDFDLQDASFIRIGDVSLSYNLPQSLLARTGLSMRSAELFVNMQDLGVFTNYSGFDPEYTEANPYPKSYSLTVGVDLKF